MSKRIITLLEDDLDGTEASQTINFGVDGTTYEIDLNDANALQLREGLAPFVSAARKIGRRR